VLVGPWRDSDDEATRDAANAGQIVFEEGTSNFRWVVPGEIEQSRARPRARQASRRS
jgi:hypothetical protein